MIGRRLEVVLWAAGLAGISVALLASQAAMTAPSATPVTARSTRDVPAALTGESLTRAVEIITTNDIFRLARHSATVPYQLDADVAAGSPPSPPRPPRPILLLSGTVGGPPWAAVVEGIPGRDGGVVVHAGDAFDGLRIASVRRDTVVVRGADTVWTLAIRRGWQ